MTWKPIASAPKDGTRVIIFGPVERAHYFTDPTNRSIGWHGMKLGEPEVCEGRFSSGLWQADGVAHPTDWQPLPLPPPPSAEPCCNWVGGNDYAACTVCGIEYDYRKAPRPPCPRVVDPAPAPVGETVDEFDMPGPKWTDVPMPVGDKVIADAVECLRLALDEQDSGRSGQEHIKEALAALTIDAAKPASSPASNKAIAALVGQFSAEDFRSVLSSIDGGVFIHTDAKCISTALRLSALLAEGGQT